MQFGGFLSCKANSLAEFGDCREGGWTGRKARELRAPQGVVSRALDTLTGLKGQKKIIKKQRKLNPPIFHVVRLSKETNI